MLMILFHSVEFLSVLGLTDRNQTCKPAKLISEHAFNQPLRLDKGISKFRRFRNRKSAKPARNLQSSCIAVTSPAVSVVGERAHTSVASDHQQGRAVGDTCSTSGTAPEGSAGGSHSAGRDHSVPHRVLPPAPSGSLAPHLLHETRLMPSFDTGALPRQAAACLPSPSLGGDKNQLPPL